MSDDRSIFPPRRRRSAFATAGMGVLALVVVLVVLARCNHKPPTESELAVVQAERAIRYVAKDADSVVFRNVETKSGGAVCGEYNGKNSFGAMAGFKRFIWKSGEDLQIEDGKDPFEHAWNHTCLGYDY